MGGKKTKLSVHGIVAGEVGEEERKAGLNERADKEGMLAPWAPISTFGEEFRAKKEGKGSCFLWNRSGESAKEKSQ